MKRLGIYIVLVFVLQGIPVEAQQPCRDTIVHFSDSICEGEVYRWGGRELTWSGVFYDTLSRALDTCDSVSILHLIVLPSIDLELISIPICRGVTGFQLHSSFRGRHQQWSAAPPDATFILRESNDAFANPSQPTTYNVHADYGGMPPRCPDSATITVNPLQTVKAGLTVSPPFLDYDHARLTLHDASIGNRYAPYGGWAGRNWYVDGQRLDYWQPDILFDLTEPYPDSVSILMQAYTPHCLDTAIAVVPFNKDLIAIPNVFAPQSEEAARFHPIIQNVGSYHLYIYNRQGRLLFQTDNPETSWDGSVNGEPQPQGAYNYRIIYSHSYAPSELHTLAGSVTLLR